MNRMILANLVHRPMRSLISIVAIAVEVILILLIVGLSLGILNDSKQRQSGLGDVMVRPPGSSFLSGISGAPVSARIADVVAKLPHVRSVAPVITLALLLVLFSKSQRWYASRYDCITNPPRPPAC